MTDLLAPTRRAHHSDGLAIFNATIALLEGAGWERMRVDTLVRSDLHYHVRHHYSAGRWELYFEPRPRWERLADISNLPLATPPREALIDLHRPPLPSSRAVLADLFGQHHVICTHAATPGNGKAEA